MNLQMNLSLVSQYKSPSQIAKVLTENWIAHESYCPNCLSSLKQEKANSKVLDFSCSVCKNEFELKSKKGIFGKKISDGAYSSMIERLGNANSPHFFLLNYSSDFKVRDLVAIPAYFLQPAFIEKRNPLSQHAKRAGWVGCNILASQIPIAGKISLLQNYQPIEKYKVQEKWNKTQFLATAKNIESRGWLLDVMNCIQRLNANSFKLDDIYAFEAQLSIKHPNNKHIKEKIRQQLQVLRDKGYIDFVSAGHYRLSGEYLK